MSLDALIAEAEKVVHAVHKRLPAELRGLAENVPVIYYDWPSAEILGEEFEPDILGMFVGDAYSAEPGTSSSAPTHILLFLENIFDEAEGDRDAFRDEVRLTYLHELGHYFGWDEADLDFHGLA